MTTDDLAPLDAHEAFEELARISLGDSTVESVMATVAHLVRRTVPGTSAASVTLVERGHARTVAATGETALMLDERQYAEARGPCLDCIAGAEIVHIRDVVGETRWPSWVAAAADAGVMSSMSIPVPLQREIAAAINIYATTAKAFDEEAVELADMLAAYAGVALANIHLYDAQARVAEQLRAAMRSRAVIEQAKGIVMAARRCTAEEAFAALVALSQTENRKLRDVAHDLVDRTGGWIARGNPGGE